MSTRKIAEYHTQDKVHCVKVYYDPEFREHQCRLYTDGKLHVGSTYFTPDKDDALGTAQLMLKYLEARSDKC